MKKILSLCLLVLVVCDDAYCWTLSERFTNAGSSGNLLDFFAPSLKPEHEVIINKIYSIINIPQQKWKVDGTYPKEGDEDLIIFLIPENEEENNWNWREKYVFHEIFTKQSISFEKVWASVKRGFPHHQDVKYETRNLSDNEMEFQIIRESPKGAYHLFGRAKKFDDKRYRVFEYRIKGHLLNESDKAQFIEKWKLLNQKLDEQ